MLYGYGADMDKDLSLSSPKTWGWFPEVGTHGAVSLAEHASIALETLSDADLNQVVLAVRCATCTSPTLIFTLSHEWNEK